MPTSKSNLSQYWNELCHDLSEKLELIEKDNHQLIRRAQLSIHTTRDTLDQLVQSIRETAFSGPAEQIGFFKETLPFVRSRTIFYTRLLRLETSRPPGKRTDLEAHFQSEWNYIRDFHTEHQFLYGYLKAAETWLDDKLFMLSTGGLASLPNMVDLPAPDSLLHNASTTVAYLHALDLMQDHLLDAEQELTQAMDPAQRNLARLTWTDSKAALIELAYALQSAGSLNDRKAGLREIIECLQAAFHIDLGHYPRVFQEILSRKSGYSNYIDKLREKLLLRIKTIEDRHDQK